MAQLASPSKDRSRINRMLGAHGLGQLEDPGVVAQLGYLVADHDHFRQLLNASEPQLRVDLYNALRPHLRFQAKPLDVYIAELGRRAEEMQLPTVTADGGLAPFKVQDIVTEPPTLSERDLELQHVNETFKAAFAKKQLEVECGRCLKTETFYGEFKQDCVTEARRAGWRYDLTTFKELCPEHAH